jgi:hypothetical protein
VTLEWRSSVYTQIVIDLLTAAFAAVLSNPSHVLYDHTWQVFYGDQDKIPGGLTACVEPSDKTRALTGYPRKTSVDVQIYVILYVNLLQGPVNNRLLSDQFAEWVEAVLHADAQLGDTAIQSLVSRVESGYVGKGDAILRATRVTFDIQSQQQLPQSI